MSKTPISVKNLPEPVERFLETGVFRRDNFYFGILLNVSSGRRDTWVEPVNRTCKPQNLAPSILIPSDDTDSTHALKERYPELRCLDANAPSHHGADFESLIVAGGWQFIFLPRVCSIPLGLVFNPVQYPIFRGYLSRIIGGALDVAGDAPTSAGQPSDGADDVGVYDCRFSRILSANRAV